MSECKDKVISSILVPFGLGKIVFQGDKDGGNVTTTNNFEKGIVATKADGKKYDEWLNNVSHFDRKPYEQDFPDKRKNIFQSSDKVTDGYTGKELPKDGRTHLDHITSANEIDTDPRANLFQAKDKRVTMANSDKNLTMTDSSLNMSKKDSDLNTWANKPSSDDPSKTNREKYGIDKKLMKEKYEQSKSHISKTLAYDQFKKQVPEVLITGASEVAKMGLQQSVGILLSEFFSSVFDEVKDVYKHSFRADFKVEGFFAILGARLKRIAEKVTSKWKDVLTAFKDGAISGFLSNLATTIINMFVTTAKRVVRMIREGFFFLLKAIKMLIFPPKGMTFKQAAHEATKLIGAGLAIT
ncbi:MAG: lactate permease, partial [Lentisphaerota bacterium]